MVKIILDAFGGDNSPNEIIKGAVKAINENKDICIVLSGKVDIINSELSKYSYNSSQIEIMEANDVITNDDSASDAIRTKKDSSIVKAYDRLKKDDETIGFISAGSTGAVLIGAFLKLGRLPGIHRPALCPILPTLTGGTVSICDCGANMDCKPEYLEQFGVMASAYHNVLGKKKPKVALLNVGTEDHKGDTRTKETFELLKNNKYINFVGNMEARDLLTGNFDVIVTDGFAGNVLLKSTEGAMKSLLKTLKAEIKSHISSKIGALFMRKTFKSIKSKFDYSVYGGAVLLGCKKLVVKAHGSSNADSIKSAIDQVYTMHKGKLIDKISKTLSTMGISNE